MTLDLEQGHYFGGVGGVRHSGPEVHVEAVPGR